MSPERRNPDRLLVVDDEPGVCRFLQEVAEKAGFETAGAGNASEFRQAFADLDPSLIVLDLQMPGTDGVELLRFLAQEGTEAQIALMSGFGRSVLESASRLGSDRGLKMMGFLEKPIGMAKLNALLARARRGERLLRAEDLAKGIEDGQLLLHYQPQVRLQGDGAMRIGAVESLARWNHAQYGVVAPDDFIPLAEQAGLIAPLTAAVFRTAVDQLRRWDDAGLTLTAAVNLSSLLLSDLQLPDFLVSLAQEQGVEPTRIVLEITETAAMEDPVRSIEILTRLRLKGFALSLDDFGSGYSSLLQLHRMPFSEVKIARVFCMEATHSDEARMIIRSIIALARSIELEVCGEGVEDRETLDLLRTLGCTTAQGFFISKPVPEAELADVVGRWNR
jgi:EAL domain-containing protein (putative c-di-GMP-specific phosphodiesterase class I)/ActR/RegA family two-component response regulator